jgi:hypothetical protein
MLYDVEAIYTVRKRVRLYAENEDCIYESIDSLKFELEEEINLPEWEIDSIEEVSLKGLFDE